MNSLFELSQNFPNPFSGETVIAFNLIKPVDEAIFTVLNSLGQKVDEVIIENPVEGENRFTWQPKKGRGLYFGKLSVKLDGNRSADRTIKMIVN
jgi:hypothetical protein